MNLKKKQMSIADLCTESVFVWQYTTNLWHAESSHIVEWIEVCCAGCASGLLGLCEQTPPSYCEYGTWRSRGPELPSDLRYSWVTVSPGVKYGGLVLQVVDWVKC
jgi:hypothetical protein